MELVGLGMFALAVVGAVAGALLIGLSRIVVAVGFAIGLLWEVSPWGRRRARARSDARVEALNAEHRQRLRDLGLD